MAIYKKPKPVEVTSTEDASEQAIGIQANTDEVVKQSAPEQSSVATRSDVLIKNLLTYSELLALVAKFPGAQVFDERDQANGYLWVRQAGGVDNANPKLVKWLGDHKFLLKAEKGWFLPIL